MNRVQYRELFEKERVKKIKYAKKLVLEYV